MKMGASDASTLRTDRASRPEAGYYEGEKKKTETVPYKGVCGRCGATRVDQQIGLEATPDEFVAAMVDVFRLVRRVLRDDGTVWLNLGDSYAGGGGYAPGAPVNVARQAALADGEDRDGSFVVRGEHNYAPRAKANPGAVPAGMKAKDLLMIPAMVAIALRADGWYLRSEIVWAKPNPMPESATDRPTSAHEKVFLLSKSARYFYDAEAIREPGGENTHARGKRDAERDVPAGWNNAAFEVSDAAPGARTAANNAKRPDGWASHEGRHGSVHQDGREPGAPAAIRSGRNKRNVWTISTQPYADAHFATFPTRLVEPMVLAGSRPGDTVLDPFCGSGTVGVVARWYGRDFVGIELNPNYAEMARRRIETDGALGRAAKRQRVKDDGGQLDLLAAEVLPLVAQPTEGD